MINQPRFSEENKKIVSPYAEALFQVFERSQYNEMSQSLDEKGYALLPFSMNQKFLKDAIEEFDKLIEKLPIEFKNIYHAQYFLERYGKPLGFSSRVGHPLDPAPRVQFNYSPIADKEFDELARDFPEAKVLLDTSKKMYRACIQSLGDFFKTIDSHTRRGFSRYDHDFFENGKHPHCLLEFCKYYPGNQGAVDVPGHIDTGLITLYLYQSSPGVHTHSAGVAYDKDPQTDYVPFEPQDNTLALWGGSHIEKYYPFLSPAWHKARGKAPRSIIVFNYTSQEELESKPFPKEAYQKFDEGE